VKYVVPAREVGDSLFIISDSPVCAIARFARSIIDTVGNLGFRSAPPRLYAIAALRGLRHAIAMSKLTDLPLACRVVATNKKFFGQNASLFFASSFAPSHLQANRHSIAIERYVQGVRPQGFLNRPPYPLHMASEYVWLFESRSIIWGDVA
jgi:hypothetical protein